MSTSLRPLYFSSAFCTWTANNAAIIIAPTGKSLSWDGMGIFRIDTGQLAEFWWMPDLFTLMEQLGLVPE
ncbi:MAG: ester cyclase [Acidiferrobacterales bacterium]